MKWIAYIIVFLMLSVVSQAQTKSLINSNKKLLPKNHFTYDSSSIKDYSPIKVDSSLIKDRDQFSDFEDNNFDKIQLDKVIIVSPMKFDNREDRHTYLILRYKTKRVWPYVVLAVKRLNTLHKRLDNIESKAGKRRYTRRVQRYINNEFKDRLKKLSKTEGQILVKLMYRQTGETTFDIVRDLRTGWRAFRYNVTAKLFTISLKEEYDPIENEEDYLIEHILQRAFQNNQLEEQDPAIDIDYQEIMEKWGNF